MAFVRYLCARSGCFGSCATRSSSLSRCCTSAVSSASASASVSASVSACVVTVSLCLKRFFCDDFEDVNATVTRRRSDTSTKFGKAIPPMYRHVVEDEAEEQVKSRDISPYLIYYNHRCSKSRIALTVLRSRLRKQSQSSSASGPQVVHYLTHPPSIKTLRKLVIALSITSPRSLCRQQQQEYRALKLDEEDVHEDRIYRAIRSYPMLLQRPIVWNLETNKAVIARPPELMFDIIPDVGRD